ncbi:hypothetical protein Tco_0169240 [Tanacetum coccineum]
MRGYELALTIQENLIDGKSDSWKLWSVAMQGGGCYGGFGYKEVTKGLLEALELKGSDGGRQGGDGGACKLLGCLLGDVIEVLEVLGEVYTKIKVSEVEELTRTRGNIATIRAGIMDEIFRDDDEEESYEET